MSVEELNKIKQVVVIDSTWNQVKGYLLHKEIKDIPAVKIESQKTNFWRYHHHGSDNDLSSAEAIYMFYKEYDKAINKGKADYEYDKRFDNLLYFYVYNYNLIQQYYIEKKHQVF